MRFSLIILCAFVLVGAVAAYGDSRAGATTTAAIPSCHALGGGVYAKASVTALSAAGASDIVMPTKGNAGKNFTGANVGIFAYGCKVPPFTVKPTAPPKPTDPNIGKYPLELGPVVP